MNWPHFFAFQLFSYISLEVESKLYHENGQINKRNIKKCTQFQFPAVEDPICVKVKRPNTQGDFIFIRMINTCELSYIECQPGYSALRVSMKNCGHFDPYFTHKRSKRSLTQNEINSIQSYNRKISNLKLMTLLNNKLRSKVKGQNTAQSRIQDEGKQKLPLILNSSESSHIKILNSTLQSSSEETSELPAQNETDSKIDDDDPTSNQTTDSNEVTTEICIEEQNNKTSTVTQKDDGCSERCPASKSMVCARIPNGVYSTFLSVCHLRVYSCRMKKKYVLVSREPCALNVGDFEYPLEELASKEEETDPLDPVLRFVRCTIRHRAEAAGGYILLRDKECLRYNLTHFHTNHYQKHFPTKLSETALNPENKVDEEPNEYKNYETKKKIQR